MGKVTFASQYSNMGYKLTMSSFIFFPFSLIEQNDLIVLVKAAVGVVLRKDMSLNRRLYAWLLGSISNL